MQSTKREALVDIRRIVVVLEEAKSGDANCGCRCRKAHANGTFHNGKKIFRHLGEFSKVTLNFQSDITVWTA